MTAPGIAAQHFLTSLALGGGLGLWYGFLRPLGGRFGRDVLFLLAAVWAWLILGFGVCKGDLRTGYLAGLGLGCLIWDLTLGRLLCPVFTWFWKFMEGIWGVFLWPVKKFLHFVKILFASAEKWVTIK